MRRLIAPVALIAVLVLAGCSAPEVKTSAEACDTVLSAWDDFNDFAQTAGRDDDEMVAMRSAMLETFRETSDTAPEWTANALDSVVYTFGQWVDGGHTTDESTALYIKATDRLDELKAQCVEDGNA